MKRETKDARLVRKFARNILAIYLDCDDLTREAGRRWYAEEHARCKDFAARYRLTVRQVAGAAAAISPGMRWENVFSHLAALRRNPEHKVPTYSREFVSRAVKCLRGADPTGVLSGPKVCAFYELLATGGDDENVVIDGHAWNICLGEYTAFRASETYRPPSAVQVNARRYRLASAAYREIAELCGEAPYSIQAATWIHWREQRAAQ